MSSKIFSSVFVQRIDAGLAARRANGESA